MKFIELFSQFIFIICFLLISCRMIEFTTTQRLADLFGVSTAKNHKIDVLSKQAVTVEVMRMYISYI